MKHLISGDLITKEQMNELIDLFKKYRTYNSVEELINQIDLSKKVIGLIFLQPSLRTSVVFKTAITKTGGNYVDFDLSYLKENIEDLRDTIVFGSNLVDAIVLRGPSNIDVTSFIDDVQAPLVNAMFGMEHFHGALWGLYELIKRKNSISNFSIGVYGFTMYSRPALAFIRLFSHLGIEIYEDPIIDALGLAEEEIKKVEKKGSTFIRDKLHNFINKVDFLFICEGLPIQGVDEKLLRKYVHLYKTINVNDLKHMKSGSYVNAGEPRRLINGKLNVSNDVYQLPNYLHAGEGFIMSTILMLKYVLYK